MLVDSHAHLDMREFDRDRDEVLHRALKGGISRIVTIGVDLSSSLRALELAGKYDFIYATVGYHPHNASQMDKHALKELESLASEPKVVAWGEIGLDFFRRHSPPDVQLEAFKEQLDIANDFYLPVIVHDREVHMELLRLLREAQTERLRGVIHCFSGDYDFAMACIEMGYHISIPGTVTYKNALQVQDVASRIPLDRLLLETDAPFLAPVPKRGKRNEPLFVTYTAQKVAQLRNMGLQELTRQVSENTRNLFKLPDPKNGIPEKLTGPEN